MDDLGLVISNPDVLCHIVDVHVHPTDSETPSEEMDKLAIKICAMATKKHDQSLVRELATKYPDKVVPCFGDLSS
jgi:Tat protein secretion system quality control protein TatD with DNase activity